MRKLLSALALFVLASSSGCFICAVEDGMSYISGDQHVIRATRATLVEKDQVLLLEARTRLWLEGNPSDVPTGTRTLRYELDRVRPGWLGGRVGSEVGARESIPLEGARDIPIVRLDRWAAAAGMPTPDAKPLDGPVAGLPPCYIVVNAEPDRDERLWLVRDQLVARLDDYGLDRPELMFALALPFFALDLGAIAADLALTPAYGIYFLAGNAPVTGERIETSWNPISWKTSQRPTAESSTTTR